jgi:hypothetical protein
MAQFRDPDANLRRQYSKRFSPVLSGELFEIVIEKTEGFSFAHCAKPTSSGHSRRLNTSGK